MNSINSIYDSLVVDVNIFWFLFIFYLYIIVIIILPWYNTCFVGSNHIFYFQFSIANKKQTAITVGAKHEFHDCFNSVFSSISNV